jgi:hypothetical protein
VELHVIGQCGNAKMEKYAEWCDMDNIKKDLIF